MSGSAPAPASAHIVLDEPLVRNHGLKYSEGCQFTGNEPDNDKKVMKMI